MYRGGKNCEVIQVEVSEGYGLGKDPAGDT